MKPISFSLVLLVTTTLILSAQSTRQAQDQKNEQHQKELVQRAVVITDVKDLDNLVGYIPTKKKRQIRIALGNLLPYAKWPKDLTKQEEEIKKNGLQFVKDKLGGQKMMFWGIDRGDVLHGDLRNFDINQIGKGRPFGYDSNIPSGSLDWFVVHFNALLLENGYTVYTSDPAALSIRTTDPRKLDRAKYFAEAEQYAIKNKAGLWKLGKDASFGKKLKEIRTPLTNEK